MFYFTLLSIATTPWGFWVYPPGTFIHICCWLFLSICSVSLLAGPSLNLPIFFGSASFSAGEYFSSKIFFVRRHLILCAVIYIYA